MRMTVLMDSTVKVTLEIDAEIPSGAPDQVVRSGRELPHIEIHKPGI
jgi:hypothetical protein